MGQHPADLGSATEAGHAVHQVQQLPRLGHKTRSLEFTEATIVAKLNGQTAQIPGCHKQFALEMASLIPGCLPACGCVQRENQTLAATLFRQRANLVNKLIDRLFVGSDS